MAPGMLVLREAGFRVLTRVELRRELRSHARGANVAAWELSSGDEDVDFIYAVFRTTDDPGWEDVEWDGEAAMALIEQFESDARNKPVGNIGRRSPDPRVVPLQALAKAKR